MSYIDKIIKKASLAQKKIENKDQKFLNNMAIVAAWSIYNIKNATLLAKSAVKDTGLGNVEDKIKKNQFKILGSLSDIISEKTIGKIDEDKKNGIQTFAKPVGIIASLTPSTNAAATPAHHIMFSLKAGNSIIISPSPKAQKTVIKLVKIVRKNLIKIGAPPDLVQCITLKNSLELTNELTSKVDLVIATGDKKIIENSYKSGKPSLGVSQGNVPVIISSKINLEIAIDKIISSKIFDNATSCSSENSIIVEKNKYREIREIFEKKGAYFASKYETEIIEKNLFINGRLNSEYICKPIDKFLDLLKINHSKRNKIKFIIVESIGVGKKYPLSGEKLSLILTLYKTHNFNESLNLAKKILNYQGIGHSAGIHTNEEKEVKLLAENLKVSKIIVNQPHALSNGGGINNSLPFSFTMGCGTWGGNSFSGNLNIKHFINITTVSSPIKRRKILSENIFKKINL